jgi:hypothetical protein
MLLMQKMNEDRFVYSTSQTSRYGNAGRHQHCFKKVQTTDFA